MVEARVIDLDGVYDPCHPNDRLLLGMKGSISEFELGLLRARMLDAREGAPGRAAHRRADRLRPASRGGLPTIMHATQTTTMRCTASPSGS